MRSETVARRKERKERRGERGQHGTRDRDRKDTPAADDRQIRHGKSKRRIPRRTDARQNIRPAGKDARRRKGAGSHRGAHFAPRVHQSGRRKRDVHARIQRRIPCTVCKCKKGGAPVPVKNMSATRKGTSAVFSAPTPFSPRHKKIKTTERPKADGKGA